MDFRTFKNSRRGLWVGRGLVSVGLVAMCVCVYFNARHGWNLSTIFADQVALATMHGLVDIATALLVSAGAILFAWHARKMGFAACLFALVLTCYSVLSVSGFMSTRIAAVESQKATLDVMQKHAAWTGGTAYREAGGRERRSLRAEMRQNLKDMVQVASVIPDSHAVAVASMTGWTVQFAQRVLILISSGMAQVIKYICLLVGFWLLSNRDERITEPANHENSGGSSGSGSGEPPKLKVVHPAEPASEPARAIEAHGETSQAASFSPQSPEPAKASSAHSSVLSSGVPTRTLSAFDRAYEAALANPHLSTRAIAAIAGCSQSTGSRVKKRVRGKADSIVRRYGNGGGYHTPAYN